LSPLPLRHRVAVAALVAAGLWSAVAGTTAPGREVYEDERDFLAAAAHLARSGTLSFEPAETAAPRPGLYREPGYPALVAATWRLAGTAPPAADRELDRVTTRARDWAPVRALHVALLLLAATAGALAAARAGGALAGGLAFALVASSPALVATARAPMSENAAAALLALVATNWSRAVARPTAGTLAAATLATALAPLVRAETVLLLPIGLLWLVRRRAALGRARAAALALLLVLPSLGWAARNFAVAGHAVLADRGGLALAVRAALDADVKEHGAVSAALAWTPLDAAREASRRRAPRATWLDHRPAGPGNFFTRTLRDWVGDRAAPSADPLALDAAYGERALARFAGAPLAHAVTMPLVGWRALFAEASPGWAHPLDLRLALGLAIGGALVLFVARALRRRDSARLAFVAPLVVLAVFHLAATEFLPRYAVPLLPIVWTAAAIELAGARRPAARATAAAVPRTLRR
jgi:hypothetical protein